MKILNDPNTYATKIAAAWTRGVQSILDAAALCADADASLSKDKKVELLAQLPFAAPTFSKLVQIGSDQRLATPELRGLLPPSYSIMYEVHLLDDEQLTRAVRDGVLHPEAKRSDIEALRHTRIPRARLPLNEEEEPKCAHKRSRQKLRGRIYAEIRVPEDYAADECTRLEAALLQLIERHGVELVTRLTPEERVEARHHKAMNDFHTRWVRIGRKLTRQRVNGLKRAKRARGERWSFLPDENCISTIWPSGTKSPRS